MTSGDPKSELACAQTELDVIEQKLAAKEQEVLGSKDKNQRASLNLDIKALERQKSAAQRKQKAALVKLRKAENASADPGASSTALVTTDDWTEHVDPSTGNPFFHNAKTGETSWTKPASAAKQAEEGAPKAEGWTEHQDPQSGRTFYYNAVTGESSWTKPASTAASPQQAAIADDGWTEHLDQASGKNFYYHAKTGETSWTKPVPLASSTTTSNEARRENIDPSSGSKSITAEASLTKPTNTAASSQESAVADDGWTEHVDQASGKKFYHNAKTGETSWTKPTPLAPATTTSDGDWRENIDPSSGNKYYFNVKTGESSWTMPSMAAQQPFQTVQAIAT